MIDRSGYAKDYSKEFKERNVEMLHLYRRFLYELRTNSRDESRQLLCLPKKSGCGFQLICRY